MTATEEMVDDTEDPFAGFGLVSHDTIASLVAQRDAAARRIEEVVRFVTDARSDVLQFFGVGTELCTDTKALAALDAYWWKQAMGLTDLREAMPEKRRWEWDTIIAEKTCPPFTEQVVRDTFAELLAQRTKFLAEKVDGIFQGLSGEHVTNRPEGFWKRMILANVYCQIGMLNTRATGLIHDLRSVIGKLMLRGTPHHYATDRLLSSLKGQWADWHEIDGGSWKIRVYQKGTAHIEVHPDIAYKLNMLLAKLYPQAIPPQFRQRAPRQARNIALIERPLPFEVISALAGVEQAYDWKVDPRGWGAKVKEPIANCVELAQRARDLGKAVTDEAESVLEALDGIPEKIGLRTIWRFDYPVLAVLKQICAKGTISDTRAHQFYPTPDRVAEAAIQLAQIAEHHRCLEPQAGLGALAARMPKHTVCVEVSAQRAQVLSLRGLTAVCQDFLAYSQAHYLTGTRFDRIVMNPPFDQGRWRAHLEAAARLLAPGGRLVAVLPVGAQSKDELLAELPQLRCSFHQRFERAFAGVSQDVVLLLVESTKPSPAATSAASVPQGQMSLL